MLKTYFGKAELESESESRKLPLEAFSRSSLSDSLKEAAWYWAYLEMVVCERVL